MSASSGIDAAKKEPDRNLVYLSEKDEFLAAKMIVLLKRAHYDVRHFSELSDFEAACKKRLPAAIIMNVAFTNGEAEEANLIGRLKSEEKNFPPIVFISENGDMESRLVATRAGVSRYLHKPFKVKKLVQTLHDLTIRKAKRAFRVLLIDDDRLSLEYYGTILRDAGIEVQTLSNPLESLEQLTKFKPDVLVTDVCMPNCSGPELAQVIRQDDSWAMMPIIFFSSEANINRQLTAIDLCGDNFLIKPVEANHLVMTVIAKAKRMRWVEQLNIDLESTLRESKFQLAAMNEHDIVSMTDVTGRITNVNDKFCEVSGFTRDELLGWNHRLLKSDRHSKEFYDDLWNTISKGEVWHGTLCNRRKDGSEYWVQSTIVPFLNDNGKPYKYVSARTDVTRMYKSEERLNRSQSFANIGNWDWNISTGELYWSDNIWQIFGYEEPASETTYENFLNAIHPEDREMVLEAVNDCVKNGAEYNIEHRVLWPDGSSHWVQEAGDVVRDKNGNPLNMLGIIQNIDTRKQAELALTERERQLHEAQALARIGSWQTNLVTGKSTWSDEVYRISGLKPGTIEPNPNLFSEIIHPDDQEWVSENTKLTEKTGHRDIAYRILLPNGVVRHVHDLAKGEVDLKGNLVMLSGTVQDITERLETETRLREAEEKTRLLLDSAGEGIYGLDIQGKTTFVNPVACKILGYAAEEMIGQSIHALIHHSYPDGSEYPQEKCSARANVADGRIHKVDDEVYWHKDGSSLPVEYISTPILRNDDVIGAVVTFRDITERRFMERQLDQQKKLLDMLHRSATDFVVKGDFHEAMNQMLNIILDLTESEYGFTGEVFFDEDGNPYLTTHTLTNIAWNAKTKEIYDENQETGLTFSNLDTLFGQVMVTGKPVVSNDPASDPRSGGLPKGHPEMNCFLGVPIFYGDKLVGMYGIANRKNGYDKNIQKFLRPFDTTYGAMIHAKRLTEQDEKNRAALIVAREEAEDANRAKSQFLSGMSHELRTPMNAIMGFGQLLKMETEQPLNESQQENVDEIVKASHHLLELINEVLDLAKIEAGRIDLSIETIAFAEVIVEAQQLIMPLAQKKGITIRAVLNDMDVTFEQLLQQHDALRADRIRLKQILLNLLSNAVKYNRENGEIIIACNTADDEKTRITITDTGKGLNEEQQLQLFKPFSRLENDQSDVEGSGIGLVITKNLVELMSGTIGLDSKPGEGCSFWVELPSDKLHPSQMDISANNDTEQSQTMTELEHEHTVLYIEDNPANLRLVTQLLGRRPNIHMWSAHEPLLGLELAVEQKPDLILLDINLPGMNGFEVLKHLRKRKATRKTPVIAISANAMPSDIDKGLKAGFDNYITKPIDVHALLHAIETALQDAE